MKGNTPLKSLARVSTYYFNGVQYGYYSIQYTYTRVKSLDLLSVCMSARGIVEIVQNGTKKRFGRDWGDTLFQ